MPKICRFLDLPDNFLRLFFFIQSFLLCIYKPFQLNVSYQPLRSCDNGDVLWLFVVSRMALSIISCISAVESSLHVLFHVYLLPNVEKFKAKLSDIAALIFHIRSDTGIMLIEIQWTNQRAKNALDEVENLIMTIHFNKYCIPSLNCWFFRIRISGRLREWSQAELRGFV